MSGVQQHCRGQWAPNLSLSLSPVAVAASTVRSQDPHALSFINLLPSNVSGYGMDNATGWAKEWGAKARGGAMMAVCADRGDDMMDGCGR